LYESTPDLPGAIERAAQQEAGVYRFDSDSLKLDEANPYLIEGNPSDDKQSQPQPLELKKVGTETEGFNSVRKTKPRFANLLSRSRSIRVDDSSMNRAQARRPSISLRKLEENCKPDTQEFAKSLPSRQERGSKSTGNGTARGYTTERPAEFSNSSTVRKGSMVPSASLSQVSGASATLFNNLKQTSSGAADRLGKAGKGFFGKITRSGSTNERELLADDNYVCSVINLPLIEQARRTRIAKRLEDCRDKTEFWMPALPYRCVE
jgi:hypothetical protein